MRPLLGHATLDGRCRQDSQPQSGRARRTCLQAPPSCRRPRRGTTAGSFRPPSVTSGRAVGPDLCGRRGSRAPPAAAFQPFRYQLSWRKNRSRQPRPRRETNSARPPAGSCAEAAYGACPSTGMGISLTAHPDRGSRPHTAPARHTRMRTSSAAYPARASNCTGARTPGCISPRRPITTWNGARRQRPNIASNALTSTLRMSVGYAVEIASPGTPAPPVAAKRSRIPTPPAGRPHAPRQPRVDASMPSTYG